MSQPASPAAPQAPAAALDRTSPLPLWAQLQSHLRQRIHAGEFERGFPGELQLATEYDVSRQTIREALRRLRSEGLISSGRGRVTHVLVKPEISQPIGALYSLFDSVEAEGLEQRSEVRHLDLRRDGVIAVRLGQEESTELVYLERLRLAGGEPLAVDRVWLLADVARPLLEADFTHTALYTELRLRCSVRLEGGSEQIHAVVPTPAEQRLLKMPPDTAAFAVDRLGYAHGRPVEWRHSIIRGDRFGLTAEWSTSSGYRLSPPPSARLVPPRRPS